MSKDYVMDDLVKDFEQGTLSPNKFHHTEHVKIAWWYLSNYSLLEALTHFVTGLKSFAKSLGKENLYHETVTWAYILLINDRLNKCEEKLSWDEFAKNNEDLLDRKNNPLENYYQTNSLKSDLARKTFLWPDKSVKSNQGVN